MLSRRDLFQVLPAGAAACLGCASAALCAAQTAASPTAQVPPAGFGEKADMTWQQVFDFSFRGYARVMKNLAAQIGPDAFFPMLQKAASDVIADRVKSSLPSMPRRDISVVAQLIKTNPIYRYALVCDVVEESESAFEIHVSQCLWAKTFRAQEAGDVGYAAVCHPDYMAATTLNPKMRMIRTKTLMQGHDCCNHRWVMET
jgi:hypothetical protein